MTKSPSQCRYFSEDSIYLSDLANYVHVCLPLADLVITQTNTGLHALDLNSPELFQYMRDFCAYHNITLDSFYKVFRYTSNTEPTSIQQVMAFSKIIENRYRTIMSSIKLCTCGLPCDYENDTFEKPCYGIVYNFKGRHLCTGHVVTLVDEKWFLSYEYLSRNIT